MTGANMICPKCKTFQPTAETCQNCGVIVAKLWSQRSAERAPKPKAADSTNGRRGPLIAAACVAVVAALAFGTWMLDDSDSPTASQPSAPYERVMNPYLVAAQQAQRAAEEAEERIRAANRAVEGGGPVAAITRPVRMRDLSLNLNRYAAELNAVADVKTVDLSGEDLEPVFRRCATLTNRYFRVLRFSERESYPLPAPETSPYQRSSIEGQIRCEGRNGTVYTTTAPRTEEDISECWSRERDSGSQLWVRMKWDPEDEKWAIYSRADQRVVDRQRLEDVRPRLEQDIEIQSQQREVSASDRIPVLVGKIEQLRGTLTAASDDRRRKLEKTLRRYERELRGALVDGRYRQICQRAVDSALDARERRL